MKETEKIQREIAESYPEFIVKNILRLGEGMDSVAYLVDDSLIFRFPKNAEIRENLAKEIKALPILQKRLNLAIPDFKFIGKKNSFVGYQKINGEFLTKELFYSFSKNEQENIQKTLADFLRTIHSQNVQEFVKCGVEIQNFRTEYSEDFEKIKKLVFPLLSTKHQEFIAKKFRQYLENDDNFSYQPVLLHNDLSEDHILIDANLKQINGIIDFGDIAIGDADYDLMYLLADYGEDFVRSFLHFFPRDNHEKLFAKLSFWVLADDLQMIVHFLEEKDFEKVEEYKVVLLNRIDEMLNQNA